MTGSTSPHLPGKLGNPDLTLATDPRLDPALLPAVAGMDEALDAPPAVGPDSSYEEVVAYAAAMEAEVDRIYPEIFGALPAVPGVRRRTEVIEGVDGNDIALFIHEPVDRDDRDGVLPGLLHTHGGGMVMCAAADPQYVRWRDELAATGLCVVGVEFRNGAGKLGDHPFPAGLNDCATARGGRTATGMRSAFPISWFRASQAEATCVSPSH